MKKLILAAVVPLLAAFAASGQECPYELPQGASMETYIYAIKGADTLRLDYFRKKDDITPRPTMILSFGGGWWTGSRFSMPPEMYLRKGFNVACIDYRISLERFMYVDSTVNGYKYVRAITRAVEDTYDATRFLLDHCEVLGIDAGRIVMAGCSAGAINSVMAEYWLCNDDPLATTRLPKGFNYAGVISGAGAIWKLGMAKPEYRHAPCPHMFIHGTVDDIVPFGEVLVPESNFGCWGPAVLSEIFKANGWPYQTWFIEGMNHEAAGIPSLRPDEVEETGRIYDFLDTI